jgi:hypothetical protein
MQSTGSRQCKLPLTTQQKGTLLALTQNQVKPLCSLSDKDFLRELSAQYSDIHTRNDDGVISIKYFRQAWQKVLSDASYHKASACADFPQFFNDSLELWRGEKSKPPALITESKADD